MLIATPLVMLTAQAIKQKPNRFPTPQETVVCGVGYDCPGEILTAYRAALDLRPYMDDRFLSQVEEVRR